MDQFPESDGEILPHLSLRRLFRTYGFFGVVRLFFDLVATRVSVPGARVVRRPFYIRGKRHIAFGRGLTVGVGLRFDAFATRADAGILIRIGEEVEMNDYVHIAAIRSVRIGDNTLIASRVFISDHNHGDFQSASARSGAEVPPAIRPLAAKPVNIGCKVWIGEGVLVLPGVTVGDGAVIGGGAVVTRDVPAGAVVVGNPARVVRLYDTTTGCWARASD